MLNRCLLVGLLPAGLLLSACAGETVPADASGKESSDFAQGYDALQKGDNQTAIEHLQKSLADRPSDPFDEINLAAAYQNAGNIDQAVPLYRDAIARGADVYGVQYTKPEVDGMSVAGVAKWNLQQIGRDEAGNPIGRTQSAALLSPNEMKYQVYFAFDRAEVTPAGEAIIREAAKSVLAGNLVHITVTGHTDTVGSDAYNLRLSERRANAVAHDLAAAGVPEGDMAVSGVGKEDLAVPTADGVREPQNRRVEIDAQEAQVN